MIVLIPVKALGAETESANQNAERQPQTVLGTAMLTLVKTSGAEMESANQNAERHSKIVLMTAESLVIVPAGPAGRT